MVRKWQVRCGDGGVVVVVVEMAGLRRKEVTSRVSGIT
jgi:hypothetical protein